jgi:hypothetical protein
MQTKIEIVPAGAGGASGGAWQQNPPVCEVVRQTIDNMRSDVFLAVVLDEFVKYVNQHFEAEAEMGRGEAITVTVDDVKACIRHDDTIKIVEKDGKEVLWLWGGAYVQTLIEKVVEWAVEYREVLAYVESRDYGGE